MKMGTKRGMQKILSLFLVMIMLFSTIPVSATGEVEPPSELKTTKAQLIISGESDNLPIKSITVTSDKGTSNEYSSLPITIDDLEIGYEIIILIEALEGFNVVKSTDSIIINESSNNYIIRESNFEKVLPPAEEEVPEEPEEKN